MYKAGDKFIPEEVIIEEETFKEMLFLLRYDDYKYRKPFEDLRKQDFVERDECPETVNGGF